jgi:hypothetical protein
VTNNNSVRAAKRRDYINDNDRFFGYHSMFNKYAPAAVAAATLYASRYIATGTGTGDALTSFRIYGELCGGGYPHKDVPTITPTTTNTSDNDDEYKASHYGHGGSSKHGPGDDGLFLQTLLHTYIHTYVHT